MPCLHIALVAFGCVVTVAFVALIAQVHLEISRSLEVVVEAANIRIAVVAEPADAVAAAALSVVAEYRVVDRH